jgi:hypothetical protein
MVFGKTKIEEKTAYFMPHIWSFVSFFGARAPSGPKPPH